MNIYSNRAPWSSGLGAGYRPGDLGSNPTRGIISKMSLRGVFSAQVGPYPGWECYNPNGKAGTTHPSIIRFKDTSLRVLLISMTDTTGAIVPGTS